MEIFLSSHHLKTLLKDTTNLQLKHLSISTCKNRVDDNEYMKNDVDEKWNFTIRLLFLIGNLIYHVSLLLKLCFGNWRLCAKTRAPEACLFLLHAEQQKMESQQPGRKDDTNPAAG